MAVQYRDGAFGETLPLSEAMEKFQQAIESGTAKALHVGSVPEVEAAKKDAAIGEQVKALASRIADIEAGQSTIIAKPSADDIKRFAGGM